jgi:pimeloyl-ACP methyl ester carboxylesterase
MKSTIAKSLLFHLFGRIVTNRHRARLPHVGHCREFEVQGFDNLTLRGWFHHPPESRGTLFILHGFCSHSMHLADLGIEIAKRFGLSLVGHDHRHHGLSDNGIPTFGHAEYQDFLKVIEKARNEGLPEPFYLIGDSLGSLVGWQAMAEASGIRAGLLLNPPGWPWDAVGKTMREFTNIGNLLNWAYGENVLHKGAAYARGDRLWPAHEPSFMVVIGSHDCYDWQCARETYDRWYSAEQQGWNEWPEPGTKKLKWFHLVEGAIHPGPNSGYTIYDWPPFRDLVNSFFETALSRENIEIKVP